MFDREVATGAYCRVKLQNDLIIGLIPPRREHNYHSHSSMHTLIDKDISGISKNSKKCTAYSGPKAIECRCTKTIKHNASHGSGRALNVF